MSGSWAAGWVPGDFLPSSELKKGMGAIRDSTLGVAAGNFDVPSIPGGYAHLLVEFDLRGTQAALTVDALLRFNNLASSTYFYSYGQDTDTTHVSSGGLGTTSAVAGVAPAASTTAGYFSAGWIKIPNYATSKIHSFTFGAWGLQGTGLTGQVFHRAGGGVFGVTPIAIDRLTLFPSAGNWDVGSRVTVYVMGA